MRIKRRKLFLRDILTTVFRYWGVEATLFCLVLLAGLLSNYVVPTTYKARATLLIRGDADLSQQAAIDTLTDDDFLKHVVQHLGSDALAQYQTGVRANAQDVRHRIGSALLLEPPMSQTGRAVQALNDNLTVEPGANDRLLHLALTAHDPDFASQALRHYTDAIVELHRDVAPSMGPTTERDPAALEAATNELSAFTDMYDMDALTRRHDTLTAELAELRARARELPSASALAAMSAKDEQLAEVQGLLDRFERLGDNVVAAQATAALHEDVPQGGDATSAFSIITPATISISPMYPDWVRNLTWACVFGVICAFSGGAFMQWLNHGVLFPEDLEDRLDLTVLGSCFRGDDGENRTEHLRMLCSRMRNYNRESPARMWLVTSTTELEDGNAVAADIARVMAEDPRAKVLHLDLDPSSYHAEDGPGFADVILDRATLDDAMTNGIADNLRTVTRGAAEVDSPLIFTSGDAQHQWNALRERFTDVIVSAPPVLVWSEAVAVGSTCDAALLVVRAEVVRAEVVSRAMEVLTSANAKIGGAMLTNRHGYIPHALYKRI